MDNLVSKVFEGLNIPFTGKYIKECPDEVTYHDKKKLPLILPTIELRYEFDFGFLEVNTGMELNGKINQARASADFMRFPEREFFDENIDNLLLAVYTWLENAHEEVKQNPDLRERYPRFRNLDLLESAKFYHFISLFTGGYSQEQAEMLEEQLCYEYNIKAGADFNTGRKLWLENNIMVDLHYNPKSDPKTISAEKYSPITDIIIAKTISAEKEDFENVKDFIIGSDALKSSNARFIEDSSYLNKGHGWNMFFPEEGNWILQEAFKEDVKQLPVVNRF